MKMILQPKMTTGLLLIFVIGCMVIPEHGANAIRQKKGFRGLSGSGNEDRYHEDIKILKHTSKSPKSSTNECVTETFHRLGLQKYCNTDPDLLNDIMVEDMLLDDLQSVHTLLGDKLTKPQNLEPMMKQIRKGVEKNPLVVEFLCEALDKGLILYVDANKDLFDRMVHHTYLLELVTNEMANDWQFMVEIQDHLLAKREAMGIPSDFMDSVNTMYALTGQLFEPIKTKTMDWVFSQYSMIRERGKIYPEEIASRQQGLSFNILEASITENLNEYTDNAMAGIALVVNPTEELRLVGENRFLEYELSQEWVDLYESWNLAFITGNLPYLQLLYPKLLIPAVIGAKPDEYMFNRALSLWVSINFYLFAQLRQEPDVVIPNIEELTQIWGKINHDYATAFVLNHNRVDLSTFSYLLGMTYEMLWDDLKLLLIASQVITEEEAQELTDLLNDRK